MIEGRPTLAAETQRALILAAGHDLWLEDATTTKVTVAGRRKDSDQTVRVTWTIDDAKRAGISGRQNWRTYPRQMLTARATAELARAIFADAIGGLAATEELEEQADGDGPAPKVEPKPETRKRRRASVQISAAPEPEPAPEPKPETITDAQRKKLQALFREKGFTDRENRLAFASFMLNRAISSSNELTVDEASKLISILSQTDETTAAPPADTPET